MKDKKLPTGWTVKNEKELYKKFKFPDFKEAMKFVNKIANIAEEINHHPDISISYNEVALSITTHSENNLTNKDYTLARRIHEETS
ncbi:MAG: 4a-hydroxytetrahydrobiopterin dehydratase [Candidatus Spechtbacterales bacterium]|nr:4a-hydroxytetrahydrobiopterin dehydratase [Candidatus Spechtbacterales bacterium]